MARCKDCIHETVCSALIEKGLPWNDGVYPAEAFCMAFRNNADVVPKSEVESLQAEIERLTINMNAYGLAAKRLAEEKADVAREIFEEIDKVLNREYTEIDQRREHITDPDALDGIDGELCGLDYAMNLVAELKKKYTEEKA